MDAMTGRRAYGGWGHSAGYYAERAGAYDFGRHSEVFANVVSVAGAGPFADKLVAHFSPSVYKRVRVSLRTMRSCGKRYHKRWTAGRSRSMAETYTIDDLAALAPQWEEVFGEPMSMGFEIGPGQVPLMKRCIREKSREPLREYVKALGTKDDY